MSTENIIVTTEEYIIDVSVVIDENTLDIEASAAEEINSVYVTIEDFILSIGKSAYEIALENGFNGTESEWLASLRGQSGTLITISSEAPINPSIGDIWIKPN